MAIEIETKLHLSDPHLTHDRALFTGLKTLADYPLSAAKTVQIADLYFDTPNLDLMREDSGLRLRQKDGRMQVTLKVAGQVSESGTHQREEIEGPPVPEILAHIWDMLSERGWVRQAHGSPPNDLAALLKHWGLQTQVRLQNERSLRNVLGADAQPLVEIVFDAVTVARAEASDKTPSQPWCELELEVKSDAGAALLPELATALQALYDDRLLPSRDSKYRQSQRLMGLYVPPTPDEGGI